MTLQGLADELRHMARADPASVIARAEEEMPRIADASPSPERSSILRSIALAHRFLGDFDASNLAADQAASDSYAVRNNAGYVEALLTKGANLFLQGRSAEGLALITSLDDGGDHDLKAKIGLQHGTVLARLGRSEEALPILEEAAGFAEDRTLRASVLKNRGMLAAQMGAYDDAESDLSSARSLFDGEGLAFEVAYCDHDLGLAAAYIGDLPAAFSFFEVAETQMTRLGLDTAEVKTSHCRALISAGLFREAADIAGQAVDDLLKVGHVFESAELRLLEASALSRAGSLAEGIASAESACAQFVAQGREDWLAIGALTLLTIEHQAGVAPNRGRLTAVIEDLERFGRGREAQEARLLLAECLIQTKELDDAKRILTKLENRGSDLSVGLMLANLTALAYWHEAAGDRSSAIGALTKGYLLLREQQALLGAADLRLGVKQQANRLLDLGLRLAVQGRDPVAVLEWMERINLSTSAPIPIRPVADPVLRATLARLRSTHDERERAEIEAKVRTLARAASPTNSNSLPPSLETEALRSGPQGVTFAVVGSELIACCANDPDSPHLHRIPNASAIPPLVRALRADLRARAARPGSAKIERLKARLSQLDELLLAPLEVGTSHLRIAPSPFLAAIPWNALPSRIGNATSVVSSLGHRFRRSLSAGRSEHYVLVAGPELDSANSEAERIADVVGDGRVLAGSAATVAETLAALNGAKVAHFAAHGSIRMDNPLFSSVLLADGGLSVYELAELESAPAVVVLSACHLGLSADENGQQLLGMITGFLNAGARSVIASSLPVRDHETTVWLMTELHSRLALGMPPPEAWAGVQQSCDNEEQLLDSACFSVFGYD